MAKSNMPLRALCVQGKVQTLNPDFPETEKES
jgi:hypothetical protein